MAAGPRKTPPISRRNTRVLIQSPRCLWPAPGPADAVRTDAGFPRDKAVEGRGEVPERLERHLPEGAQPHLDNRGPRPHPARPVRDEAAPAVLSTCTRCRHTDFMCGT